LRECSIVVVAMGLADDAWLGDRTAAAPVNFKGPAWATGLLGRDGRCM